MMIVIPHAIVSKCIALMLSSSLVSRRLPPAERRGYSSVFNALYRITKEEGLLTLWRVSVCVIFDAFFPFITDMDQPTRPTQPFIPLWLVN